MIHPNPERPDRRRLVRSLLVLPLTVGLSVVWAHALAGCLRFVAGATAELLAPSAWLLTALSAAGTLVASATAPSVRSAAGRGAALGLLGAVLVGVLFPAVWPVGLALVGASSGAGALSLALLAELPADVEDYARARPRRGAAWLLVATLATVQISRLATHMSDPSSDWFLSTRQPFYAKHECLNAYLHGAELNARGEPNIYDAAHYPGLTRDARPDTSITGMAVEDPFQYPPPFLVVPRLLVSFGLDYGALRSLWFGVSFTFCIATVLALARWVGGRVGAMAALSVPLLMLSFPVLHNLQYGQFHFAAIALSVLAMLAFEAQRRALGGGLLAMAILSKVFPGALLLLLVGRGRFREALTTLACVALLSAAALPVVGIDAFEAFFSYQLPRLSSGAAFAFEEAWPEVADLVLAGNQGALGIVSKLEWLGWLPRGTELGQVASLAFSLLVLVAAFAGGRRLGDDRAQLAATTLGILGLASLTSTGAWADYVPLTCVWLLTYLLPMFSEARWIRGGLLVVFVLQATLIGSVPLGDAANPEWMMPISLVSALALAATFLLGVRPWPWSFPQANPTDASLRSAAG